MDFLELVENRYSCRSFSTKEVEKEKIEKILKAAKLAPTARNLQPQRILVIQDEEKLSQLSKCTKFGWGAKTMFIICYDKNVSWKSKFDNRDEGVVDASIVATHMMLEIQDLGLGTTWIGYFDSQKVREIYKIPQNYEIVALMPVGYPAKDSKPSEAHYKRNNIESMVFWEEIE